MNLCLCSHEADDHIAAGECIRWCGCQRFRPDPRQGEDAATEGGSVMCVPPAGTGPDVQRRYLLEAAMSVERALPPPGEHGLIRHGLRDDEAVLEFAAKAEHLAACVFAVDLMCRDGRLPRDWQPATGEVA